MKQPLAGPGRAAVRELLGQQEGNRSKVPEPQAFPQALPGWRNLPLAQHILGASPKSLSSMLLGRWGLLHAPGWAEQGEGPRYAGT